MLQGPVTLAGAVYAPSARLRVESDGDVQIRDLVAVDSLLKSGAGALQVSYASTSPLIAIGRPVLIR
jgi:hypothetical protein